MIGGNTPERYIWRLGIALFSFPRILDSFLYLNFFSGSPGPAALANSALNGVVWLLHMGQYFSLFLLSYVSSTENYGQLCPRAVLEVWVCFLRSITCSYIPSGIGCIGMWEVLTYFKYRKVLLRTLFP